MAPKARRYTEEEMAYALALYFQGAWAYRFLQKQFVLPSTRVLRKNMEKIRLQPGFHEAVLSVMKEKFSNASRAEKMCVVSFDEMGVRSKLTYLRGFDPIYPGFDLVEGYEDHEHLGRREAVANYALVFMVRGLTASPNGNRQLATLSSGPTKASTTKDLLVECVKRLQEAGMHVVATVCDMGTTNQQAYQHHQSGASSPRPTAQLWRARRWRTHTVQRARRRTHTVQRTRRRTHTVQRTQRLLRNESSPSNSAPGPRSDTR